MGGKYELENEEDLKDKMDFVKPVEPAPMMGESLDMATMYVCVCVYVRVCVHACVCVVMYNGASALSECMCTYTCMYWTWYPLSLKGK